MSKIPGVENRVTLKKKMDLIASNKKNAIDKNTIMQIVENVSYCTTAIPKFRKVEAKMSLNSMANMAY
jgi:hypothetical protein